MHTKQSTKKYNALNNVNKNQAGFTLIETIIYIGLYGLIIGGVVIAAYSVFESIARNQTKAMAEQEGTFIIGKIDWALTGATAVNVSVTQQQLYINRDGLLPTDNPLTFDGSGGLMRLSRGNAPAQVLNNTNVTITNPVFIHTITSSDGVTPESIRASFTIIVRTPNGQQFSEDFSTTKYLRK